MTTIKKVSSIFRESIFQYHEHKYVTYIFVPMIIWNSKVNYKKREFSVVQTLKLNILLTLQQLIYCKRTFLLFRIVVCLYDMRVQLGKEKREFLCTVFDYYWINAHWKLIVKEVSFIKLIDWYKYWIKWIEPNERAGCTCPVNVATERQTFLLQYVWGRKERILFPSVICNWNWICLNTL